MHFLDEVMFELLKLFDAFALRVQLSQQGILFDRNPINPPKTNNPVKGTLTLVYASGSSSTP
jgi:hypothetical protein